MKVLFVLDSKQLLKKTGFNESKFQWSHWLISFTIIRLLWSLDQDQGLSWLKIYKVVFSQDWTHQGKVFSSWIWSECCISFLLGLQCGWWEGPLIRNLCHKLSWFENFKVWTLHSSFLQCNIKSFQILGNQVSWKDFAVVSISWESILWRIIWCLYWRQELELRYLLGKISRLRATFNNSEKERPSFDSFLDYFLPFIVWKLKIYLNLLLIFSSLESVSESLTLDN